MCVYVNTTCHKIIPLFLFSLQFTVQFTFSLRKKKVCFPDPSYYVKGGTSWTAVLNPIHWGSKNQHFFPISSHGPSLQP